MWLQSFRSWDIMYAMNIRDEPHIRNVKHITLVMQICNRGRQTGSSTRVPWQKEFRLYAVYRSTYGFEKRSFFGRILESSECHRSWRNSCSRSVRRAETRENEAREYAIKSLLTYFIVWVILIQSHHRIDYRELGPNHSLLTSETIFEFLNHSATFFCRRIKKKKFKIIVSIKR